MDRTLSGLDTGITAAIRHQLVPLCTRLRFHQRDQLRQHVNIRLNCHMRLLDFAQLCAVDIDMN